MLCSYTYMYNMLYQTFSTKQVENNLDIYSNWCKHLSLHVLVMGIKSIVEAMIHKEFCPAE